MTDRVDNRQEGREYVLGTHREELVRLGLQHQVWRGQAYEAWERAGFTRGQTLLDLGCGPGYATRDLAELVGESGRVIAFDASRRFLDHIESARLPNVECRLGDALDPQLTPESIDGAYCRWLMCFLPDPARAIAGVAHALRPGSSFVVQDYVAYSTLRLMPRDALFERVIDAVRESWRSRGGDPDIGCRLPALMRSAGLEPTHVRPISRVAGPNTLLWQWPTSFFANYLPVLVELGLITPQDRLDFEELWRQRSEDESSLFLSPLMLEVVAEKAAGRARVK